VGRHGVYCAKLDGEDLSRYLNGIESVGLRKTSVLSLSIQFRLLSHPLTETDSFVFGGCRKACLTSWRENSSHRYGMKEIRHRHPMYIAERAATSSLCDATSVENREKLRMGAGTRDSRESTDPHNFFSVHVRYMLSPVRLSSVCRLSACNIRAPY